VGGASWYSPFGNRCHWVGVSVCTGTEVVAVLVQCGVCRPCNFAVARSRHDGRTSSNRARHYRQPTVETTSDNSQGCHHSRHL